MKRLNKKLTTLLLAGVCAASLCAATHTVTSLAADASTYKLGDVFVTTGTMGTEDASFTLTNGQNVRVKRDLALKWYEGKDAAKYFSMSFSFASLDFDKVTFEMESATSVANEDEKAVNAVAFKVVTEGEGESATKKLQAAVINADTTDENTEWKDIAAVAGTTITLSLKEGSAFDSFGVVVNDGTNDTAFTQEFTQIGANFADYNSDKKMDSLDISAATAADKSVVVGVSEINGQKFDKANVIDGKIVDTAAPVLVVNEDVTVFQYGTAFSLSYEVLDVLQNTGLTTTKKYYQWNPTDTEVKFENDLSDSSTYLMDTVFYKNAEGAFSATEQEGYTATSVLKEYGAEYIAVQYSLTDSASNTMKYDLAWYAETTATKDLTKEGVTTSSDYIVVNVNLDGPFYKLISTNQTGDVYNNVVDAALDAAKANYEVRLAKAAKDISAGSDSKITLPDVEWLIDDNTGYRALRFTISYKTPSSSSPKTASGVSYNGLKFTVTEEGEYEFKIFAVDRAGNSMKYANEEGELVEVSTSNVWDIKEIPSFRFTIGDKAIGVEEPSSSSSKQVSKTLDQTYSLSGLKVTGTNAEKADYALYRFDSSTSLLKVEAKHLTAVKYADLKLNLDIKPLDEGETYFTRYLDVYAEKVAKQVKAGASDAEIKSVRDSFKEIKEYNSNIPESAKEWKEYAQYKWSKSSKSFYTAEEGNFIMFADFSEDGLGNIRAGAYKVVVVENKKDVIKGESQIGAWIKNNIVSVILFGIAGLMLIAIIVLLLVKPSDETLEEVEENATSKKEKKAKSKKDDE